MQPMIFVGGAPRSGTTVTHALLCTSARTSPYHPEVGFLRPMINAYTVGIQTWEAHTHAFFKDQPTFRSHMQKVLGLSLDHLARRQGNPEILCMKDPLLTPLFFWVHHLFGDMVKLVTVVRNPHSVVRSRQEVIEKTGRAATLADIQAAAQEYMKSYQHLAAEQLKQSLFVLRYEDLESPGVLADLRAFTGCADIDPNQIWAETRDLTRDPAASAWGSPKYHGKIDTKSRFEPLSPEFAAQVDRICAPMMQRFQYQPHSA